MIKNKENNNIGKALEEMNKKLDALIILQCVENLSGNERLNILKHSVGIKPTARILEKDKSYFKKKLKSGVKNAEKE
ncbi:hypothetical protein HYT56_02155 [Candidatus Woesearchaeota archaeon]|nr:hypothetical protein [Candidatus Woesearchaeota archaeon]